MTGSVYAQLAARFDKHHKDPRGMEYLTGEQVVSRLNEVLGPGGWTFEVREHGYDEESDEMWALGEMRAYIGDQWVLRQQFGSQKHNRRRTDNKVIDYGFDAKGAATDALKKCATLIGVGLYLSEKEGGIAQQIESPAKAFVPLTDRAPDQDRDIVRTADDEDWQKWLKVKAAADRANVKTQEVKLGVDRIDLQSYATSVADEVRARRAPAGTR